MSKNDKWVNLWFSVKNIIAETDKSVLIEFGASEGIWFNKNCVHAGSFLKVGVNKDWLYKIVKKDPQDKSSREVTGEQLAKMYNK